MSETLLELLFKKDSKVRVINPKSELFGQEGFVDECKSGYVTVKGFYGPHYLSTFHYSDLREVR